MRQNNYQGLLLQPIDSGFNAKSTSTDIIKGIYLTGKIAIVTGGVGIGLKTTKNTCNSGCNSYHYSKKH